MIGKHGIAFLMTRSYSNPSQLLHAIHRDTSCQHTFPLVAAGQKPLKRVTDSTLTITAASWKSSCLKDSRCGQTAIDRLSQVPWSGFIGVHMQEQLEKRVFLGMVRRTARRTQLIQIGY